MPLKSSINPHLWKYKINTNFFKNWNSQMAYTLGFILADGGFEPKRLTLALKRGDKELLKKINRALCSNYPIKPRGNASRLRISNPIVLRDLQRLGIKFGKMKNNAIPNIPSRFLRDFVRGYLDGDGWITTNKRKMGISIGFSTGNRNFLQNLVRKIDGKLNLNTNNLRKRRKITKKNKTSICYSVEYYSNNAYKIIKYLYDGFKRRDLFLMRKYQKQLKARKIYEDLMRGTKLWRKIEDKHNRPMKETLFHLHKEKGLDGPQIAKKLGVHSSSIYRWLGRTEIKIPNKKIRHIIVVKCPICSKEIRYYRGQFKKYCSSQCRLKTRQTGKMARCVVCGEKLYRPKWWFKVNTIPFCSRVCFGKWQRLRLKKNLLRRNQRTGRFLSSAPFKF